MSVVTLQQVRDAIDVGLVCVKDLPLVAARKWNGREPFDHESIVLTITPSVQSDYRFWHLCRTSDIAPGSKIISAHQ